MYLINYTPCKSGVMGSIPFFTSLWGDILSFDHVSRWWDVKFKNTLHSLVSRMGK